MIIIINRQYSLLYVVFHYAHRKSFEAGFVSYVCCFVASPSLLLSLFKYVSRVRSGRQAIEPYVKECSPSLTIAVVWSPAPSQLLPASPC
jgi:hypothetical protein